MEVKTGKNLRKLLRAQGLTANAFHMKAQVPYAAVHALLKDRARRVDLTTLGRMCATLGCKPGDLLTLSRAGRAAK